MVGHKWDGMRKNGPRKNGPQEKWSPEKWSPEEWSTEKCPSKIVLHQKNARKFKRLFHFYQLIPLHTQKDVWRLRHDPIYASNCRTLKESRKICCRVLGFQRSITSEHSTHPPRRSTLTPRFVVSEFPGTNFPGIIFPGTIFLADHFSEDHLFRGPFFRGLFFRDSNGISCRYPLLWGLPKIFKKVGKLVSHFFVAIYNIYTWMKKKEKKQSGFQPGGFGLECPIHISIHVLLS